MSIDPDGKRSIFNNYNEFGHIGHICHSINCA